MSAATDVVIVGGGPAGLAAAIELGMRGIQVLIVERNPRGGTAPRAKTTNVRTRTHLRRWGIADRLAAASPFGIDYPNNMVFVTSLAGPRLAFFPNAFNAAPERSPLYPEHGQWIPQYTLEKVLLEHARSLPNVAIRFGATFVAAEQDASSVTATIHDEAGEESVVTAKYLIGADGARSTVRALIGGRLEGRHGLSHSYNIIFRAPGLAQAHSHGPAAIYWQLGPQGFSAIGPMDRDDTWFFMPGGAQPGETLSDGEARALIVARTGIDLPFEILSADFWTASELLADRYSDRRILLAGDACHLHPPYGGYGMNMGIGDGVELGWKIAATLQGWGGPALIDSYAAERRPVHKTVIEEAVANHMITQSSLSPEIEDATPEGERLRAALGGAIQASKGREFYTLGTVLGLCYERSPVIEDDGSSPAPYDSQTYTPSARPGCLAPHAWLADGHSLYDLFGDGFTLLVSGAADDADVERAIEEAKALGIPLKIVRPGGVDIAALYEARMALIRPDQHVAWRGDRWRPVLGKVTGH